MAADRTYKNIVIGDTAGHIKIWDISGGVDTRSLETCKESFKEVREGGEGGPPPCTKGRGGKLVEGRLSRTRKVRR